MSRKTTTAALEKLEHLLNKGSAELLMLALTEFEEAGLSMKELINFPIRNHNGRTLVHLAARNGVLDCLELLLVLGGIYAITCTGFVHCCNTTLEPIPKFRALKLNPSEIQALDDANYFVFTQSFLTR